MSEAIAPIMRGRLAVPVILARSDLAFSEASAKARMSSWLPATIALLAARACGPIALAWQATTPRYAPAAAVETAIGFDDRMESRRSVAAEVGLQWVRAWLTTSSKDAEKLRGLYAGEVMLPKQAAAVADLRVVDAIPSDVGVWSVTVVATVTPAGTKTGVTRYFAVPVTVSGGGEDGPVAASPMSVPAPVQGPGPVQTRTGGDYPTFVNTGGPLGATVSAFLGAYLGGADGSRSVTPGASVRSIGDCHVTRAKACGQKSNSLRSIATKATNTK